MLRVVVDTNVLVSSFIKPGKARRLVSKLLEGHIVVLSSKMLAELADVLTRDKFGASSSQVDRYLSTLISAAKIVEDSRRFSVVSEDPDDDVVLNTAYTGKAGYIVTGDNHLLGLSQFKRARIVTINQMLETLGKT
jgi:putative PIN family toxin of toxin-antitoxin system